MSMIKWIVVLVAAGISLAAASMLPQVLYGKRIAGQVVDADSGQPIAGAHVAYVWESSIIPSGFTGHNSRTICYHAAATTTDEQGRFRIEPWRKWSTYDVFVMDPHALVYARNYTPRQILLHEGADEPPIERLNERYALSPFSGTVDERMDAMWGGIANRGCMYGGESQKSLYPMLKAMYDEARQIGASTAHARRAYSFAVMAGEAALAHDPNGPSKHREIEAFINGNLK